MYFGLPILIETQERASQLLKDAEAEGKRLCSASDSRSQQVGAELERLRGKISFLENDNVSPLDPSSIYPTYDVHTGQLVVREGSTSGAVRSVGLASCHNDRAA